MSRISDVTFEVIQNGFKWCRIHCNRIGKKSVYRKGEGSHIFLIILISISILNGGCVI
jgi:hypothetical protein